MLILVDGGGGSGDYENVGKFVSIEDDFKNLKSSSKGILFLKKMNIGNYVFYEEKNEEKTEKVYMKV